MYKSVIYVCSYSLAKNNILRGRCEKEKHVSQKALLLAPKFVFFYTA
jgi:hypothetical protein